VEQPEDHPAEVIASRHHVEREWSGGGRFGEGRLGAWAAVLALLVVGCSYGWSAWNERAQERARSGAVQVTVEAPLPFSADRGAAKGIVRLRNDGPLGVSVLSLAVDSDGLRLGSLNLPALVPPSGTRLLAVRLELDCTAAHPERAARSVVMRTRTADREQHERSVTVQGLPSIVEQMRRQECDPAVLPVAEDIAMAYAGIISVSEGRITTRVLVINDRPKPVTIRSVSAVSGWPLLDPGPSSRLPLTVPAHRKAPLDLRWDVSTCVRSQSGRFSSGLHLQLVSLPAVSGNLPAPTTEELAVLEPGIDYTRDFFRAYGEVCP